MFWLQNTTFTVHAAKIHEELAELLSLTTEVWKKAMQHERDARKEQRLADNELRAQHSQALQMRLDIERAERERETNDS